MAGFESFAPGEGGESYDPAAFERFKERLKKNSAVIAALVKSEKKQKKKEDTLLQILLMLIQSNQKRGVMLLATRLLAENIPASFVLALIILGNEDIQREIDHQAQLLLEKEKDEAAATQQAQAQESFAPRMGTTPADYQGALGGPSEQSYSSSSEDSPTDSLCAEDFRRSSPPSEFSLVSQLGHNSALPLKMRGDIDSWCWGVFEAGSSVPFKVLETTLDKEGHIKGIVTDAAANVLDDYLASMESESSLRMAYDGCRAFAEFMLKGVMRRLKEQVESQRQLGEAPDAL
ncbi:hypothetical protein CO046_00765 [Candidatus Peregrinibacteria bacterium CG_4_9_14_0_2_um_filter_53_11]|nr:MAG: hypothetical protein CO046_00765 [Candidatus Peregrinibacteria bacterium CG_4_9_14_0_2_um_filter_53_11]